MKLNREVFIASAARTPIGRFGGALAALSAVDLGVTALAAALERGGVDPGEVGEVIVGMARQAGNGPNPARQISMRGGLAEEVPAWTVNKACGSGLKAIMLGAGEIALGEAHVIVAGGTESMSRVPYMVENARWGLRLGHQELTDGMYRDGFHCPLADMVMGETAEKLADIHAITREEQDAYALGSQLRAGAALRSGRFREEMAPVDLPPRKGAAARLEVDEHVRLDISPGDMQKLRPVFRPDGTVTAANSSGITDGAAMTVLASDAAVAKHQLSPLARIVAYTTAGVDPKIMGIGPVPAVRKLLVETGMELDQFGLVELNEAFAAQVIACLRELPIDPDRLNVNGGAIAMGHPIGCTGARIVTTLVHEMHKRNERYGLATLCISGGMGIAMALEKV
jgi:acetyl-CoA C-acetyltransferase